MFSLSCKEILTAVKGQLVSGNADTNITGVSTDSRKISAGCLFVPLKGDNFDGHDFIEKAFDQGAAAAFTHKDTGFIAGKTIIRVEDTLAALRNLASFYRNRFSIPFIGITGSVGKTSTKDMLACVMGEKFYTLKTEGNLNNEIGLPLMVFKLEEKHQAAILEMGMNSFGEISRLTSIVKPQIAIITNIGLSHIEKLGSRQNILKAKLEILEGLNKNGLVILNGDDNLLSGVKDLLKFRTVSYGIDEGVDYQAYNINSLGENGVIFDITVDGREYPVRVPAPGIHNIHNALAAIAAGHEMGISMDEIIKGVLQFSPSKMRLNITVVNGVKIINDTYNASPHSMEAAINVMKEINTEGRRIAVLGDMLEMGDWAHKAHCEVGKYAALNNVDYLITVGPNAKKIALGAREAGLKAENIVSLDNNIEAISLIKNVVSENDVILVKGSRGMKMEEIVGKLYEVLGN